MPHKKETVINILVEKARKNKKRMVALIFNINFVGVIIVFGVILTLTLQFNSRPKYRIEHNTITNEYKILKKERLTRSASRWENIGVMYNSKEEAIGKLNSHIKKKAVEKNISESWKTILEVPSE